VLPACGAVVGIDIGFSITRRSSAICLLAWDRHTIEWQIDRFRALPAERDQAISRATADRDVLAVAVDGPVRSGLDLIKCYRTAERMLTNALCVKIGKPGQSNSPMGLRLNEATNACLNAIIAVARIGIATHRVKIHERCIVEAFPSSFLGLMLADPASVLAVRHNRSDKFFETLTSDNTLTRLLRHFLPRRTMTNALGSVRNHDDRAALICALSALAVASNDFCAVGDRDGWIILPPRRFIRPWAWRLLTMNANRFPEALFVSEASFSQGLEASFAR
jgi:hypothetical protein